MRISTSLLLISTTLLWASGLVAGTRDVSNVTYAVAIDDGEEITTPGGTIVAVGVEMHGSVQDQVTGESFSQWCTGESYAVEGGMGGAGYCTLIADNGDVLWVSYVLHGAEPSTWTVMGGTGQYEGATGSGMTENVSQRGDGEAWTSKSTGKLTTK